MDGFEFKRPQSVLFRVALGLGVVTMTVALGLFAYLGTFTRFLADDYCDTVTVNSGPILLILIEQYETYTDRFSNFLFIALSEFLFPHNVEILPVIVIFLWTAVLTWLIYETRRIIKWQWHFFLDFFLAALLVFFAILQAPNRFQTFYWRSAMATHFAPLMYLTAFAAFLLMVARRNQDRYPSIWMGFLCLVLSFLGGGFSEPPDAVLIIASALALAAAWVWVKGQFRRPALMLLSWTLAGGLLALIVMALSPGNILGRSQAHRPEFAALVYHTFLYSALFIRDTFLTFPLPTLFSIAIPFFLFYGIFATSIFLILHQPADVMDCHDRNPYSGLRFDCCQFCSQRLWTGLSRRAGPFSRPPHYDCGLDVGRRMFWNPSCTVEDALVINGNGASDDLIGSLRILSSPRRLGYRTK